MCSNVLEHIPLDPYNSMESDLHHLLNLILQYRNISAFFKELNYFSSSRKKSVKLGNFLVSFLALTAGIKKAILIPEAVFLILVHRVQIKHQ